MKTLNLSFALIWVIAFQSIQNTKEFFKNLKTRAVYYVKDAYYSVINFRKARKFKKFEKLLEEAQYKQDLSQAELMVEISERIRNFYPKSRSLFIPLTWKEKREIKAAIEFQYGDQMAKYKIKLSKDLKFI